MAVQKLLIWVAQRLTCFMRGRNTASRKDSNNDVIGTSVTIHTHCNYYFIEIKKIYINKTSWKLLRGNLLGHTTAVTSDPVGCVGAPECEQGLVVTHIVFSCCSKISHVTIAIPKS